MKIQLVVFDMAGTTVRDDDAVNTCLQQALEKTVAVTRDEVNAVMGLPKPIAIQELLKSKLPKGGFTPVMVDAIHADFLARMLSHYRTAPGIEPMPHTEETFARLKEAGVRVALDTGFSRPIVDAILQRLGWREGGILDATVASDEVRRGRPHPDLIWKAMELTGIREHVQVAKVGDTPSDLLEGTAAGCGLVVGVTNGTHTREELMEHPHTHLLDGLRELPALILQHAPMNPSTSPVLMSPVDPQFPPARDKLLFTPGPLTTSLSVKQAMLHDAGSWHFEFNAIVAQIREALLQIAGLNRADGWETILLQGSGTFGVEAVFESCVPPEGKVAVLTNGAYGERMAQMLEQARLAHSVLRFPEDRPAEPGILAKLLKEDAALTHVAAVHCETTTGILNPIEGLGQVARQHGKLFIVDAMSSFGGIPIDFQASGIDFLISSPNKCLEGVPGFCFVLCRRQGLEACEGCARSLSLDLLAQLRGFDRNGQFRFTPPTHSLLAFEQALKELHLEGGISVRAERYGRNHQTLLQSMADLGFHPFLQPEVQSYIITAFEYPAERNFSFAPFYRMLSEKGFIIYPGKLTRRDTFRIGTIGRIFPADIQQLVQAIGSVLEELDRNGEATKTPATTVSVAAP